MPNHKLSMNNHNQINFHKKNHVLKNNNNKILNRKNKHNRIMKVLSYQILFQMK